MRERVARFVMQHRVRDRLQEVAADLPGGGAGEGAGQNRARGRPGLQQLQISCGQLIRLAGPGGRKDAQVREALSRGRAHDSPSSSVSATNAVVRQMREKSSYDWR